MIKISNFIQELKVMKEDIATILVF